MNFEPTMIKSIDEVLEITKSYIHSQKDLEKIKYAAKYATDKFKEIKRKNGDPYVYHLYSAAYHIAKWECSPSMIIAALLHDLIEDIEEETYETVRKRFGGEVAFLVDKVTKIRIFEKEHQDLVAASMRKILLGMAADVRVMVLKMADRQNNIETLKYLREKKRKQYAKETLEIYVPIAKALGFNEWANKISDLCFYYSNPESYEQTEKLIEVAERKNENLVKTAIKLITKELIDKECPILKIYGRKKSVSSIHNKLIKKHLTTLENIHDIFAIRIICKSIPDCYTALGVIHQNFLVVPRRFKDYISSPKGNMYQSLHTTISLQGRSIEVQIKTEHMNQVAEQGIASHWKYKEGSYSYKNQQNEIMDKIHILKSIIQFDESSEDQTEVGWWKGIQEEILSEMIICLTPQKKAIELKKGSTVLDFAFHIHTEVGLHAVKGIVNGDIKPLRAKVSSGDIIEIKTQAKLNVSEKWLNWATSATTRNRIRRALKVNAKVSTDQKQRENKIISGQRILMGYLKGTNLLPIYKKSKDRINEFLLNHFKEKDIEEVYIKLNGKRKELAALYKFTFNDLLNREEQLKLIKKEEKNKKKEAASDIIVDGIEGAKTSIAKCCFPVWGDDIVSSVSATGIKIHRKECKRVPKDVNKVFEAKWSKKNNKTYQTEIFIEAMNTKNTINSILSFFGSIGISINKMQTNFKDGYKLVININCDVNNLEMITNLLNNMKTHKTIILASRKSL